MTDNYIFQIYYGPQPSPKFYYRGEDAPKRNKRPYMVGAAQMGEVFEWAPGTQRTLLGALLALWKLKRKLGRA